VPGQLSLLFASIHSGLDPCSGGALAAREMLERLAGRGALPGALGRRDRSGSQRRPDGVHANGVKPRRALTGPERATEFRTLEGAREMCMASPELPRNSLSKRDVYGVSGTPSRPRNSHDRVRTSVTVAGQGPRRAGTGYGLDATRCRRARPFGRVRLQPRPCATPAPRSRSWPHWPSAGSSGSGVRQGRPGCSPRGRSSCSMRSARSLV